MWGGGLLPPLGLQTLCVRSQTPHHTARPAASVPLQLQRGGYVAPAGIPSSLKRRWLSPLVEAPRSGHGGRRGPGPEGGGTRQLPGAACAAPLGDPPRRTRLPASGVCSTPETRPDPEAKAPEGGHDPCGLLTRLSGPSITSIDPGASGGLRKWSDGAGAHGGEPRQRGRRSGGGSCPLRARGATTAPLPPPVARRGPAPCAAATHASWRHTWLVQGGSEDREWVGPREGGARTGPRLPLGDLSSRERRIFSFWTASLASLASLPSRGGGQRC